jgi:hypothetical protein
MTKQLTKNEGLVKPLRLHRTSHIHDKCRIADYTHRESCRHVTHITFTVAVVYIFKLAELEILPQTNSTFRPKV